MDNTNTIKRSKPIDEIGKSKPRVAPTPTPTSTPPVETTVTEVGAPSTTLPTRLPRRTHTRVSTQVPAEPVDITPAEKKRGRSTTVYFSKGEDIDRLEHLGSLYPRATVSSVISQLVAAFLPLAEELLETNSADRSVTLNGVKIYV